MMARNINDSFLPSGAAPAPPAFAPGTFTSPSFTGGHSLPRSNSYKARAAQTPSTEDRPLSPPKTRSASADNDSEALVEDWRVYTAKLRSQNEGERAHMMADRARVEEVMNEERELWDKERAILKLRIVELELELEKALGSRISPPLSQRERMPESRQLSLHITSPSSNTSVPASDASRSNVPQESGRNTDGSPFYAPAPQNPSRTFEPSEVSGLRVDTITAVRESPIRVTSKELTPSDFGVHSPPTNMSELETIPETENHDYIDISLIQPDLEGVPIRASAVAPEFAATVLSPQGHSPAKLSPNIRPPGRALAENLLPLSRDTSRERNTIRSPTSGRNSVRSPDRIISPVEVVMLQPETRRLTMHAGHTPNHSISKLSDIMGQSGSATPTTQQHTEINRTLAPSEDQAATQDDGDKELRGPLSLPHVSSKDDAFLAQLVEKLEEAKRSEGVSPNSQYSSPSLSPVETRGAAADEEKDLPPLRLKPSLNFGRPMGQM